MEEDRFDVQEGSRRGKRQSTTATIDRKKQNRTSFILRAMDDERIDPLKDFDDGEEGVHGQLIHNALYVERGTTQHQNKEGPAEQEEGGEVGELRNHADPLVGIVVSGPYWSWTPEMAAKWISRFDRDVGLRFLAERVSGEDFPELTLQVMLVDLGLRDFANVKEVLSQVKAIVHATGPKNHQNHFTM